MNGNLPPEVWAERAIAATLNLNDLGSESRAVDIVVGTITRNAGRFNAEDAAGGQLVPVSATGDTTHTLTSEGADASEDGTGRGTPVVNTETSVRRLTPMECERLQGFPDGWTLTSNGKPQADSARYRQMGNSVAVPCIEWVVRRIIAQEES